MHYFDWHIKSYQAATAHLTNEEDLAYRRLLDMYYDTEMPIPTDTDWVSRRLRVGSESVKNVLADFFILTENGWVNEKCEQLIGHYQQKRKINQQNGRNGGRPKNRTESEKNPVGFQSVTDGNPVATQSKPDGKAINNKELRIKNKEIKESADESAERGKPVRVRYDPLTVELPECVSSNRWGEWVKYRSESKKPLTETTVRQQLANLTQWHQDGHDANEIIGISIANSWQGLFPPKKGNGAKQVSTAEANAAQRERLMVKLFGGQDANQ